MKASDKHSDWLLYPHTKSPCTHYIWNWVEDRIILKMWGWDFCLVWDWIAVLWLSTPRPVMIMNELHGSFTSMLVIQNFYFHFDHYKEMKFRNEAVWYWPKIHPKWNQMFIRLQNHVDLSEGLVIISHETVVKLLVQMMDSRLLRE
jgi:hypothetical protein